MYDPSELLYTAEHLWIEVDGDTAKLGITDYAQEQVGEILYANLPLEGDLYRTGEAFAEIESAEVTAELTAPFELEVLSVNGDLDTAPELINEDAYAAWIAEVKILEMEELANLLSLDDYEESLE